MQNRKDKSAAGKAGERGELWYKAETADEISPDEISIGAILFPANTGYLLDADAKRAREETYTREGRGEATRSEAAKERSR